METNYICFTTLSTGTKYKLTQETYNQILEAEKDDFITLPNGTTFKNSAVMEIQDIRDWVDEKSFSYGQPYTALPAGIGFKGLITREHRSKAIELMAKGLKKSKKKFETTPNIDNLLKLARERYSFLKQDREPINKHNI